MQYAYVLTLEKYSYSDSYSCQFGLLKPKQYVINQCLHYNYFQGFLTRLGALRVTTGHTYYYRKLDEFGKEFAVSVEKKVKGETNRLKNKHELSSVQLATRGSEQPQQSTEVVPSVVSPLDKGRKLVFDNFDFRQQVHTMTEEHQNVDVHWCTHMAVENRVSGNHLSDTKPDADYLLQMENGLCLPSPYDHHLQRQNYITLTTRAIVEIPSLAFLKPVVCQHIQHQYSKETREKSEMVWYLVAHH